MFGSPKFANKSFILKVITLAIGVVVLGLTADTYFTIYTEEPFLAVVCITFIVSFLFLLGVAVGFITENLMLKRLEIFYHIVSALLLFMTGSVFLFSVIGVKCTNCSSLMTKRYIAAFLGLLNGFMYGLVAWNLLDVKIVSRNSVEGSG